MSKAIDKKKKQKTRGHRVNFLVNSDMNEKSGLENPFGMLPW